MHDSDKCAAALAAVAEVRPGMIVGLGTGSTAAFAIEALGRLALDIRTVATSRATESLARSAGLTLIDLPARIDLTIDGTDEIDDACRAIKGAGGAMLREKIVAAASTRMIVIADGSKHVAAIGQAAVPVEVLPFAEEFVAARLQRLGADPVLREDFVTDQGNIVLDCHFVSMRAPVELAARIGRIPGVLGHGLFLDEVDAAYLATGGVVTRLERATPSD